MAFTIGTIGRPLGGALLLFSGTILISIGIALGNMLLPSLIKRDFPEKITLITTSYVTLMTVASATASGITVPVAVWPALYLSGEAAPLSWRASLAVWAIVAIAAVFAWLSQTRRQSKEAEPTASGSSKSILKSPIAWQVTTFMSFQSMAFYVIIAWLSPILQSGGHSTETSGWLLAFYQITGLASGLLLPVIIAKTKDQRLITVVCGICCSAAALGLFLAPEFAVLWLTLAGFGGGGSFILAIAFISLRSRSCQQTPQCR